MKKTVIIAAAGRGTRLGAGMPKCLVEVNGHAIFEYQLKALQWADEIRMVVGFQAEEVVRRVYEINPKVVFIHNNEFLTTNLRQSYYKGAQGVKGKALFLDGDTIIGSKAAETMLRACEQKEDFIAVVRAMSKNPIYAGVEDEKVQWFSYDKISKFELENAAYMDAEKIRNINTLFYVQLEEYLPTKALELKSLEIDTPEDLEYANREIVTHRNEYDFWR